MHLKILKAISNKGLSTSNFQVKGDYCSLVIASSIINDVRHVNFLYCNNRFILHALNIHTKGKLEAISLIKRHFKCTILYYHQNLS